MVGNQLWALLLSGSKRNTHHGELCGRLNQRMLESCIIEFGFVLGDLGDSLKKESLALGWMLSGNRVS